MSSLAWTSPSASMVLEDGEDVAPLLENLSSHRILKDALVETLETVAGQGPDDLEDLGGVVGVGDEPAHCANGCHRLKRTACNSSAGHAFSPVRGQAAEATRNLQGCQQIHVNENVMTDATP
jgi:hypothetical protein